MSLKGMKHTTQTELITWEELYVFGLFNFNLLAVQAINRV